MHAVRQLALLCVYAAVSAAASGQGGGNGQEGGNGQDAVQPPARTVVEQKIAELTAVPQEEQTELQRSMLQRWQEAKASLDQADVHRGKIADTRALAESGPELLQQLQAENAKPLEELVPQVDRSRSLEALRADLDAARAQLQAAEKLRDDARQDERDRAARRALYSEDTTKAATEKEQLNALLAGLATSQDPPELIEARRARLQAGIVAADLLLQRVDLERRTFDARDETLAARVLRANRRIDAANRYIQKLEDAIAERQLREAERRLRQHERNWGPGADRHPVIRRIYDRTDLLLRELIQLGNQRDQGAGQNRQLTSQLGTWSSEFARSSDLIEQVGLTDEIGLHLRDRGSRLPEPREHERSITQRQKEMGRAQYRRSQLEYDVSGLLDIQEEVEDRLAESEVPLPEENANKIREDAAAMLSEQRELLVQLTNEYDIYFNDVLLEANKTERELVKVLSEYRLFIESRVLWVQSAAPVRLSSDHETGTESDLTRAGRAIAWLVRPQSWQRAVSGLWTDLLDHPAGGICLALLVGLAAFQRRLRRMMAELRDEIDKPLNDRIWPTVLALFLSVLRAALLPGLIGLIGWRLLHVADDSGFAAAMADGFRRASVLLFAGLLLSVLCRSGWVGDAHFDWSSVSLKRTRRNLRWLIPLTMPLAFVVAATRSVDAHYDSLGRFAFIAAMIALAIFAMRILRPGRGVLRGYLQQHQGGWIDRLKYIWFPLIAITPLGLAAAAWLGYFYTAAALEQRVLDTVWMALFCLVLHALLMRWLSLTQRRLAIEQWRKRRAVKEEQLQSERKARVQATSEGPTVEAAPTIPAEVPVVHAEPDLDVVAVSSQTQRLVRTMIYFGLAIGLVAVWAQVLPALAVLDDVKLWDRTEIVRSDQSSAVASLTPASSDESEDGQAESPQVAESIVPVTARNLLIALFIVVMTIAVSRNIPGLLEIVILSRLPLSAGARYAWVTIVRYALVIIGLVIAFAEIGITWNSVQWLAAAITVGLGFGLQEIFANFVSGLIILFERPIRVGDTVTVGDVNGTVAQIRMRATMIVDWDRKELIVPNREFVTGRVINWTLSDPVMRVRIPVGIAYGSDVELARKTLLEVANRHHVTLSEPAPQAVFLGFGDSALNLELRVFINHIENFVPIRDMMHTEIDAAFRQAGIEISFPQRDIHLRSIHFDLPPRGSEGSK